MSCRHQRLIRLSLLVSLSLVIFAQIARLERPPPRAFSLLANSKRGSSKTRLKFIPNLVPLEYELKFELQPDKYHCNVDGEVKIYVEFLKDGKSGSLRKKWQHMAKAISSKGTANTITLSVGAGVAIKEAKVEVGETLKVLRGGKGEDLPIASTASDEESQLLALTLARPWTPSPLGRITLKFTSQYQFDFMRFSDRSKPLQPYLNFHFPPDSADRTFPCFNQPDFKSKFTLRVIADRLLQVYSNTPELERTPLATNYLLVQTIFEETPPMPVHKFVFSVGSYDVPISLARTSLAPAVRVITPNGEPQTGQFALELAQRALEWMARQVGQRLPIQNFDLVATHIHHLDTTQSLGCALINLDHVLIDERESSAERRILSAFNVAYVVARQWFGSFLSVRRWQDTWILNGLATKKAFAMLRELHPELGVETYARSHLLTRLLQAQATRAIQSYSTQEELEDTSLAFIKHAAMMSMAQSLVGRERFQEAVKSLFKTPEADATFGNVIDQSSFVAALSEATEGHRTESELNDFFDAWRTHVAFPTLSVQLDQADPNGNIQIYQNPATKLTRLDVAGLWPNQGGVQIPFKVLFSNRDGSQQEVVVMRDAFKNEPVPTGPKWNAQAVAMPSWFDLQSYNSGHWVKVLAEPDALPLYRVRYMPGGNLLGRMQAPIQDCNMMAADRASLLDAASTLVPISGKYIEPTGVDNLLKWFAQEQDPLVLNSLLLAKKNYALMFEQINEDGTKPRPETLSKALPNSERIFAKLGFLSNAQETVFEEFVRGAALTDLIESGHKEATDTALSMFDRDRSLSGTMKAPMYLAVVKAGSRAQVRKLVERLNRARWPEEIDRLRAALEHSKDELFREQARDWCKTRTCS